ncbi:MAG TPA: FHA domain-containing protein [Woeseiaceae bacterium]|nr:FHA domain-containing protein [Woeseiaceae bacterium]
MQDVFLKFLDGPMRGQEIEVEVGSVIIGRQPGASGVELKGADVSVSRQHAGLHERDGNIFLSNRSPNGTSVNGKLVLDEVQLKSGAIVEIADQCRFAVSWKTFAAEATRKVRVEKSDALKKGPLSSPVVRTVIGVYLLGMLVVGLWLAHSAGDKGVADDWPELLIEYQAYRPDSVDDSDWQQREERGAILVRELRALKTRGRGYDAESICRELMSLDRDSESPVYRYGARCLASR